MCFSGSVASAKLKMWHFLWVYRFQTKPLTTHMIIAPRLLTESLMCILRIYRRLVVDHYGGSSPAFGCSRPRHKKLRSVQCKAPTWSREPDYSVCVCVCVWIFYVLQDTWKTEITKKRFWKCVSFACISFSICLVSLLAILLFIFLFSFLYGLSLVLLLLHQRSPCARYHHHLDNNVKFFSSGWRFLRFWGINWIRPSTWEWCMQWYGPRCFLRIIGFGWTLGARFVSLEQAHTLM